MLFVKSPFFLVHSAFWVGEKSPFLMIICAMVKTLSMGCGHPCGHPSHIENHIFQIRVMDILW